MPEKTITEFRERPEKAVLYYYRTPWTDPAKNLAFEEYLLKYRKSGDIFLLWQNDRTVVVGRNQDAEAEVNLKYAKEHGIRVVRRSTGGGAVYHDPGNVNYSFFTDFHEGEAHRISDYAEPVVRALNALGLDAFFSGRNDILVSGRRRASDHEKDTGKKSIEEPEEMYGEEPGKIYGRDSENGIQAQKEPEATDAGPWKVCGTAERIDGSGILSHGCIMFDVSVEEMQNVLTPSSEKLGRHGIASVKSRVKNIRDFLPEMTTEEFLIFLRDHIPGERTVLPLEYDEAEFEKVLAGFGGVIL